MTATATVKEGGIIASAALLLSVPLGIAALQPGPSWLWTGDACPGREGVCGIVPFGLFISVGIVALLISVIYATHLKAKPAGDSGGDSR